MGDKRLPTMSLGWILLLGAIVVFLIFVLPVIMTTWAKEQVRDEGEIPIAELEWAMRNALREHEGKPPLPPPPPVEKPEPTWRERIAVLFNDTSGPGLPPGFTLIGLVLSVPIFIWGMMRWRRMRAAHREITGIRKAGWTIAQMRASRRKVRAMRGRFSKIYMISLLGSESHELYGSAAGARVVYSSFLLGNNGGIWTLEESTDQERVEENARWLAESLGIPFELR